MQEVVIVTDTATDIPDDLAQELGIVLAPVHLFIKEESYRDRVDITTAGFYRQLAAGVKTSTSGVNIEDFVEAYQKALELGKSIVCLTISAPISVTLSSARSARELFPDADITVIDSRTVLASQGLIAVEAAKAARAGRSKEEVIALVEVLMPRAKMVFTADTLEYMRRGGRLHDFEEMVGSLEGYRPILRITPRGFTPIGKVRTREESLSRLLELMEEDLEENGRGEELSVAVDQALALEDAEALAKRIEERLHPQDLYIWDLGPTAASHLGPGMIGVAWCSRPENL